MKRQKLGGWIRFAQVLVAIGLCYWLLHQIDWSQFRTALAHMRWQPLALSVVFLLVAHSLNILRWQYLLQAPALRFRMVLRWYAIGVFCNNFLPTGIGGDGVRVALLSRSVALGQAVFSVMADRGIGLVAISAVLVAGVWAGLPPGFARSGWQQVWATSGGGRLMLLGIAVAVLVTAGLLARWLPSLRAWVTRRSVGWQWPQWAAAEWIRHGMVAYCISVGAHLCIVAATWATLVALRIDVPLAASIWLVVLSSLSLLLPVTINGMGLVESVYVLVLSSYGVAPAAGLSAALIVRGIALLISLSGGVFLIDRRMPKLGPAVE